MRTALSLLSLIFFVSCGGDSGVSSGDKGSESIDLNITNSSKEFQMPFDTYMQYSWHLQTLNNSFSKTYEVLPNSDINISAAWQITRGKGVKIAIIDANFDVEHEDIKENIAHVYNADNGYFDRGDTTDVSNSSDDASHGTTCAGFAAASINTKGTVGSAPEASLILISQEALSDSATIYAFEYAKKQGAKVISCSWGTENVSQAVADELESLHNAGIVVLFAVGNDAQNLDAWWINDESELPSVLGIGASNEKREVAFYSNYGRHVDLLAPGGNIQNSAGLVGLDDSGEKGDSQTQRDLLSNSYAFVNGTSFSAPISAGVVALMLSANPSLLPEEVRTILIESTDKIGDGDYNKEGFDRRRAYGKINAGKAVARAKVLSR